MQVGSALSADRVHPACIDHARPMELRPATRDDAPAVAAIWEAGWRDGHVGNVPEALVTARTPESFRTRAPQRTADTTVAVVDGEVAGFTMAVDDEVEQVYVDARHRGGGVATALLSDAERRVREAGHERAWLAVVPGNARARRFYERQGWVDIGLFDHAAPTDDEPVPTPCHRYEKRVQELVSPGRGG